MKAIKLLAAILCLVLCGFFALAEDAVTEYTIVIDDTHPVCEEQLITEKLRDFVRVLSILQNGNAHVGIYAASNTIAPVLEVTDEHFDAEGLWMVYDGAESIVTPKSTQPCELPGKLIWISLPVDEEQIRRNILAEDQSFTRPEATAEGMANTPAGSIVLDEKIGDVINKFKSAVETHKKAWSDAGACVCDFGADVDVFSCALKAADDIDFHRYEGSFTTGDGLADPEKVKLYFVLSDMDFSDGNVTALPLFNGLYYAYVADTGVQIRCDGGIFAVQPVYKLYSLTDDNQLKEYSWADRNVSFDYGISITEEAENTVFDPEQWNGYAIVTSENGDMIMLPLEIDVDGNAAFDYDFDEYGKYSVSFTAINRKDGETLVSENKQLTIKNAAPYLRDDTKEYCAELELALLDGKDEHPVELSAFYADDRHDAKKLTYYVNDKKISGSEYIVSAKDFNQSAELVVDAADPEGLRGAQTKIKIKYIQISELAGITAEEFDAEYTWENRKVPLNCSINDYDDIWNVTATIYNSDDNIVSEEELSYDWNGAYSGEFEFDAYGTYTVEYSAMYEDHEEGLESVTRELTIVNTKPVLKKEFKNYEASEVKKGSENEIKLDLAEYYMDDRLDAKNLKYSIENKPGWVKQNGTEIKFNLNDVKEATELHIKADDGFEMVNEDGVIHIAYVPAEDTVTIVADGPAFEGTTVTMVGALEKKEKGNNLDCVIEDGWSVSAEISCGTEILADNITLSADENGRYKGTWRIEETGAYSKDYIVVLKAKYETGKELTSESQTIHVENNPPKPKNNQNELCVMQAAGLKLDSNEYTLNLADCFTDDKNSTITYQLKDESGNCTDAIEHAMITNGILIVDPEGINQPMTIYVVASDNEGAEYSDAYVSIAYTPASAIAELKFIELETEYQWTDLPIRIDCEIICEPIYSNMQKDWNLSATITRLNKSGGIAAEPEQINEFTIVNNDKMNGFESLIDENILHNESGKFRIEVEAEDKFSGDSLSNSVIVTINNEPPVFTDKLEDKENGIIETFFVAPVEAEKESLVITDYYNDSKDGKDITCTPGKASGFSTQGDTYFVDPSAIQTCSKIDVTAEDKDGSENKDGYIQIIYLDFAEQDMPESFDLKSETEDEIHRNSTLSYAVDYAYELTTKASDPTLYEGYVLEKSGLADAANDAYVRYLETLTVHYEVTFGSKKIINEHSFDLNKAKKFSFSPDKDFDIGDDVVEPGKYTLEVWITAGRENETLAKKQVTFEICNIAPMQSKQADNNTYECTIPLKASAENGRKPADIDLEGLVSAESRETIKVTPSANRSKPEGWSMKLYRTEDGYLYTDTAREGLEEVSNIKWRTDDKAAATKLTIDVAAHGKTSMSFDIRDDQNAGYQYNFTLRSMYKNEKVMIYAGIALAAIIVLLVITIIIIKATKPAFRQNDVIKVKYNSMEMEFKAASWKKDGITLREILIYSGLPITGSISMKDCDAAVFSPDKKNDFAVSFRKDGNIRFSMSGAEQKSGFKVPNGESVTVQLNDEDKITVTKA